jgi:threonine dehydratase
MTVTDRAVDQAGIAAIHRLIAPHIRRTPVVRIDGTDLGLAPGGVLLKLEQLQHSGSFKARGAFANLLAR